MAAETQNFLLPNATIFVDLPLFVIILLFFYRFIVPPLTKAMAEREEMVRRQAEERDAAVRKLAEAQERYEAALADARAQATAVKDEARARPLRCAVTAVMSSSSPSYRFSGRYGRMPRLRPESR